MNAVAKNTFIAMVSLALFYFIFLESNSFYLSSMSSFSLEPRFVTTIVPIMGLNALGFLCYPLYSLKLSRRKRRGTALIFAILWIACLIIAATVSSPIAIVGAGYLSFNMSRTLSRGNEGPSQENLSRLGPFYHHPMTSSDRLCHQTDARIRSLIFAG